MLILDATTRRQVPSDIGVVNKPLKQSGESLPVNSLSVNNECLMREVLPQLTGQRFALRAFMFLVAGRCCVTNSEIFARAEDILPEIEEAYSRERFNSDIHGLARESGTWDISNAMILYTSSRLDGVFSRSGKIFSVRLGDTSGIENGNLLAATILLSKLYSDLYYAYNLELPDLLGHQYVGEANPKAINQVIDFLHYIYEERKGKSAKYEIKVADYRRDVEGFYSNIRDYLMRWAELQVNLEDEFFPLIDYEPQGLAEFVLSDGFARFAELLELNEADLLSGKAELYRVMEEETSSFYILSSLDRLLNEKMSTRGNFDIAQTPLSIGLNEIIDLVRNTFDIDLTAKEVVIVMRSVLKNKGIDTIEVEKDEKGRRIIKYRLKKRVIPVIYEKGESQDISTSEFTTQINAKSPEGSGFGFYPSLAVELNKRLRIAMDSGQDGIGKEEVKETIYEVASKQGIALTEKRYKKLVNYVVNNKLVRVSSTNVRQAFVRLDDRQFRVIEGIVGMLDRLKTDYTNLIGTEQGRNKLIKMFHGVELDYGNDCVKPEMVLAEMHPLVSGAARFLLEAMIRSRTSDLL